VSSSVPAATPANTALIKKMRASSNHYILRLVFLHNLREELAELELS
jgi:hypothetical protein